MDIVHLRRLICKVKRLILLWLAFCFIWYSEKSQHIIFHCGLNKNAPKNTP